MRGLIESESFHVGNYTTFLKKNNFIFSLPGSHPPGRELNSKWPATPHPQSHKCPPRLGLQAGPDPDPKSAISEDDLVISTAPSSWSV